LLPSLFEELGEFVVLSHCPIESLSHPIELGFEVVIGARGLPNTTAEISNLFLECRHDFSKSGGVVLCLAFVHGFLLASAARGQYTKGFA
jgi:hypothetical protein